MVQVCALGNLSKFLSKTLDILNLFIPPIPCNALNPSRGTFEHPVTNCKNSALSSLSKLCIISQKYFIIGVSSL